jgi:hypothetical protein
MSETFAHPEAGHNLPPITRLADEMTDHASKWSHHAGEGERHEREIMVRAYQLRVFAEDPAIELQITGLLSKANVPQTQRSSTFTRYLNYAFHKAKQRPEKSQISRWAGALQFAWSHDPRPAPENVLAFIKSQGGDVECARKARQASRREVISNETTGEPVERALAAQDEALDALGRVIGKDVAGGTGRIGGSRREALTAGAVPSAHSGAPRDD